MTPRPISPTHFLNRHQWRSWLAKNHASQKELWLLFYKKHTGKPTLPYDDAVEEALCYGWIDGLLKRIDDQKHMLRFSPRRPGSVWSESNLARVKKMIAQGKMTTIGLEKARDVLSGKVKAESAGGKPRTPSDLKKALQQNKKALTFFRALAPSYRKQYIWWVTSAKRPETRQKRIKEVVKRSVLHKKPGIA